MAKNTQPVLKRCRTLGVSPAAMGYSKQSNRNPGGKRRTKKSEYGTQLTEKQKVKFVYGILEKQFHTLYEKAESMKGNTGENLLSLVERRLDNVVYRMGLAESRKEARQLVLHSHFTINGKKADIPSIIVKKGDVIALCDSSRDSEKIKSLLELMDNKVFPSWLDVDKANAKATVVNLPAREDIDFPFQEHLIVELYSK